MINLYCKLKDIKTQKNKQNTKNLKLVNKSKQIGFYLYPYILIGFINPQWILAERD